MGRLIDADRLLEIIMSAKELWENRTDTKSKHIHISDYQAFIKVINMQPTAYDVDKVVERLRDMTIEELGITDGQFMMDEGEYSSYCTLSLADVIEIVKGGGV